MIIGIQQLREFLDSSGLDNQGVTAAEALAIVFGEGEFEKTEVLDRIDTGDLAIDVAKDGRVLSIEL